MALNWLDIILLVILGLLVVLGLAKGFLRQFLGLVGIVVGFILALSFYPEVASFCQNFIRPYVLTEFLAFLLIWGVVVLSSYLLAYLLAKALKGPIKLFDRLLGGVLGLLKGVLVCGILLLALVLFPVNPKAVEESRIAPLCLTVTKGIVCLIPQELKDKFDKAYRQLMPSQKRQERGQNERRI
ncbi:MAG TPA: CvpA family protein [Candidatus Aminicenantes bacterium]|nr:CvpA family protein [Candidatus Aminicenantes bacterium]